MIIILGHIFGVLEFSPLSSLMKALLDRHMHGHHSSGFGSHHSGNLVDLDPSQ
jgi:hypothetical protein